MAHERTAELSQTIPDADFIRRAVEGADLNALRVALYYATGDESLRDLPLTEVSIEGGGNGRTARLVIDPEHAAIVVDKAIDYLTHRDPSTTVAPPSTGRLLDLMELLYGGEMPPNEVDFGLDALAVDEFPRAANWSGAGPEIPTGFEVAVIGSGWSGIAAGAQLQRLGIPYRVYERRHEIGGVWSINTYPDARVDTTNFIYQFSFEKKFPWTEFYARQDEVRAYITAVAERHGVAENIEFGSDVTDARFDEEDGRWHLTIVRGDTVEQKSVNVVISAAGLFATPKRLDVPGINGFEGERVHTTSWSDDVRVEGRRVAVVGNGSTGVQLLSRIAQDAEHVDVFQRTAQWIGYRERYGEPVSAEMQWLLDSLPYYWNWYTYSSVVEGLRNQELQEPDPEWQAGGGLVNPSNDRFRANLIAYIERTLEGRRDLIEKVTPSHAPMARRLVADNNWYRTLLRDNVSLVTDPLREITADSIVTVDGVAHPVDLIVEATGFQTTRFLFPTTYTGRGGLRLEDFWSGESGGPRAYLSMTVPHFPNLFILYGPNSQPRSTSLIVFIEIWAKYAAQAVVELIESGSRALEVREDVFEHYNEELDRMSETLVWNDPGSRERNYYVNEFGRQQINAPWLVEDYYGKLRHFRPEDYRFER